jgi:hypothetical protein
LSPFEENGPGGFATRLARRDALAMSVADSRLDPAQVAAARTLLKTPVTADPMWPALLAATALALAAVAFAGVAVLAPPTRTEHVVQSAPG